MSNLGVIKKTEDSIYWLSFLQYRYRLKNIYGKGRGACLGTCILFPYILIFCFML
jgi:hypothetical protein